MCRYLFVCVTLTGYLLPLLVKSQELDVHADMRMRYEFRNGYATIRPDSVQAAHFVTQRNRLRIDYSGDKLKVRFTPQNVRVWGDVTAPARRDLDLHFHEAWAELQLGHRGFLKLGRQELDYADARILGNADWGMQARSHDLVLAGFRPDTLQELHIGAALNASRESIFKEKYMDGGMYRLMQFGWYKWEKNRYTLSLLVLNQGVPFLQSQLEKIAWNQTTGVRVTRRTGRWYGELSSHVQTGYVSTQKLKAWQIAAIGSTEISQNWKISAGFERLSGQPPSGAGNTIRSFTPWFGTNHKFNGYMDYFYVGNHRNNVGLLDLYGSAEWREGRVSVQLTGHYFEAAVPVSGIDGRRLGVELDATLRFSISRDINVSAGYSQMMASPLLEHLKGGTNSEQNNWAYAAVHVSPRLFHYKFPKN